MKESIRLGFATTTSKTVYNKKFNLKPEYSGANHPLEAEQTAAVHRGTSIRSSHAQKALDDFLAKEKIIGAKAPPKAKTFTTKWTPHYVDPRLRRGDGEAPNKRPPEWVEERQDLMDHPKYSRVVVTYPEYPDLSDEHHNTRNVK